MLSGNIAEQNLHLFKRDINEPCKDNLIVRYNPGGSLKGEGCYYASYIDKTFNGLSSLNNLSTITFADPYTDQGVMDNGYCIKHCADYLFSFAAIGNGLLCKCSNDATFPAYKITNETLSDETCNDSCTFPVSINSNSTYQCGGKNAYTIYEAKYDKKPDINIRKKVEIIHDQKKDNRYIGCIHDNFYCGKRAMNDDDKIITDENLTVDKCIDLCRERKFKLAGLEAGNQCFCSDSYIGLGGIRDEHCSSSCVGNSSQICGGSWALMVGSLVFVALVLIGFYFLRRHCCQP
ncbi:19657_t:CDS:2 [Entrophospora sp. SA101]|nr:19657_t:CDS:2 [Entrophospora sp. SA101]